MVYIKFQYNAGIYLRSRNQSAGDQSVLEVHYTLMFRSSSSISRWREALLQGLVVRCRKMSGLVNCRPGFLFCQRYMYLMMQVFVRNIQRYKRPQSSKCQSPRKVGRVWGTIRSSIVAFPLGANGPIVAMEIGRQLHDLEETVCDGEI